MKIKIPHLERRVRRERGRVVWQAWYWVPSKRLRAMGWKVMALGKDQADAQRMAIRQNKDVERSRPTMQTGTVAAAIRAYRADEEYPTAEATRRSYEQNLAFIEKWAGDKPLAAVTPRTVKALKKSLAATPYKANAVCGMIRILYGYAMREGLVGLNPASKFRRIEVHSRTEVWEPEHEALFAEAALGANKPSLWIAAALSLYAGQRQTDCLAMEWTQYDGHRLRVLQSKTDELVEVPVLGPLKKLLDVADRSTTHIVVSEATKQPYNADTFRHEMAGLIGSIGLKGELQYRDLRRTAVVRMHWAGLSVEEISGFTGHSLDHTKTILETYLPRGRRITDESARKLESYYKELGKQ